MRRFILFLMFALQCMFSFAQEDPTRIAAYLLSGKIEANAVKVNTGVIGVQAGQHLKYQEDIKKLTELQDSLDASLKEFKRKLVLAAQIYGIFYEAKKTFDAINSYKGVLAHIATHQTTNVVAVGYSKEFQGIYKDIKETGIQIGADVAVLIPIGKHKSKLTKLERIEKTSNLRKNLHKMNAHLFTIVRLLKYTTLMDVWYELTQTSKPLYKTRAMSVIAGDARREWIRKARGANEGQSRK